MRPFICCYLGNFGGNADLVAPLHKVSAHLGQVGTISNCIGIGSTLEGINVNPVIYDMVLSSLGIRTPRLTSMPGSRTMPHAWPERADPAVRAAWNVLVDKVYLDSVCSIWPHCADAANLPRF